MRSLLVTSAGSGVGSALMTAIAHSVHPYRVIVLNSHDVTPVFSQADAAYLSPLTSEVEAFKTRLLEVVAQEKPELLLAGRDEELPLLAQWKSELAALNCNVPGASSVLMSACTDKYLTWKKLKNIIPVVPTAHTPSEIEALICTYGFPVVLKPRSGFASKGVIVAKTRALLEAFLAEATLAYIVQPLLRPDIEQPLFPEYSGQILIGHDGSDLHCFASSIRVEQGQTTHLQTLSPQHPFAQFLNMAAQHMIQAGFRGPYNIQAMKNAQGAFLCFEINARCTGLTGLRAQLGWNEVDWLYDSFVHQIAPQSSTIAPGQTVVLESHFRLLSHEGE